MGAGCGERQSHAHHGDQSAGEHGIRRCPECVGSAGGTAAAARCEGGEDQGRRGRGAAVVVAGRRDLPREHLHQRAAPRTSRGKLSCLPTYHLQSAAMEVDWGGESSEAAAPKSCGVQASFDEYLQDRARVFRAMFPDESRSQRIGDVRNHAVPLLRRFLPHRLVISGLSSEGKFCRGSGGSRCCRCSSSSSPCAPSSSCSCGTAPAGSTSESCVKSLTPPRPQLYQFFAPTFRRPRVCCW
jgi:hypothetical protein